jgi:fatty-acyl-CoA synthase
MLAGSTLVLPGPAMSPEALLGQMQRHRVTFAAGVPTIWRSIQPLLTGADLTAVRMLVSGGGALPDALSRAWEQAIGVPLTSSWGMTETSPLVCCSRVDTAHADLPADDRRLLLGVPGPNMPFTRLRILDEDGRPVAHDGVTPGELQAAGPTVAGGYFGDDSRTAFTEDGWLRTGDVATIDQFGYLRIVDRTKDLVKSGGEWISSVALENEIMAHPSVREAAVIAVADERWGERPLACVVPAPGHLIEPDELREFLKARVSSWWVPEQIWVLAEIPKTSTGKFSKLALRAQRAEFEAAMSIGKKGQSG